MKIRQILLQYSNICNCCTFLPVYIAFCTQKEYHVSRAVKTNNVRLDLIYLDMLHSNIKFNWYFNHLKYVIIRHIPTFIVSYINFKYARVQLGRIKIRKGTRITELKRSSQYRCGWNIEMVTWCNLFVRLFFRVAEITLQCMGASKFDFFVAEGEQPETNDTVLYVGFYYNPFPWLNNKRLNSTVKI